MSTLSENLLLRLLHEAFTSFLFQNILILFTRDVKKISTRYRILLYCRQNETKGHCVIAGFEPADIINALILLTRQVRYGRAEVENAYPGQ
jgi:hypothetical protein